MSILQSLASWIAYAIAGAFMPEAKAAAAAGGVALLVIALALRSGRRPAELAIEISSAIFFCGYAVIAWVTGAPPNLTRWVGAASQFWLTGTVALGLAMRRPFTLPIARRSAPAEVHQTPAFYAFNVRLTRAWLGSFLASGIVLAVAAALHESHIWLNIACIAAAIVAPTLYTRRLVRQ